MSTQVIQVEGTALSSNWMLLGGQCKRKSLQWDKPLSIFLIILH